MMIVFLIALLTPRCICQKLSITKQPHPDVTTATQTKVTETSFSNSALKSRQTSVHRTAPENLASEDSPCIYQDHDDIQDLSLFRAIQSVKVTLVDHCKMYCLYTNNCSLFSFHNVTRICTLYTDKSYDEAAKSNDEAAESNGGAAESDDVAAESDDGAAESDDGATESDHDDRTVDTEPLNGIRNVNITVGSISSCSTSNCLETLEEVEGQSKKSGVRIMQQRSGDCLGLKKGNASVDDLWNDSKKFRLVWKKCSKADLWVVTRTNMEYMGSYLMEISLLGKAWTLRWDSDKNSQGIGYNVVYVAKRIQPQNVTHTSANHSTFNLKQSIFVEKDTQVVEETSCSFTLYGPDFINYGTNEFPYYLPWHLLVDLHSSSSLSVKFSKPYQRLVCPLNLPVRHGRIINEDMVPFFLEKSVITIECNPGYGIRSLNYTSFYKVECTRAMKLKSCKPLKRKNLFMLLTIITFAILFSVVIHCWSKRCRDQCE